MERRDFLKAAPLALAGVALPVVAEAHTECRIKGGLIDPVQPIWGRQGEWTLIPPEKQAKPTLNGGEPSEDSSVIRVEITPAGPLPVIEMMGPYLTNPNVFFGDMEWAVEPISTDYHQWVKLVKSAQGFLRKEDAVSHKSDCGCFWVCCGAVELRLVRFGKKGVVYFNIYAIPESTLYRVDGSALRCER